MKILQNALSTLGKYIDHVHTVDGKPTRVTERLEKIIINNFNNLMKLRNRGIQVF